MSQEQELFNPETMPITYEVFATALKVSLIYAAGDLINKGQLKLNDWSNIYEYISMNNGYDIKKEDKVNLPVKREELSGNRVIKATASSQLDLRSLDRSGSFLWKVLIDSLSEYVEVIGSHDKKGNKKKRILGQLFEDGYQGAVSVDEMKEIVTAALDKTGSLLSGKEPWEIGDPKLAINSDAQMGYPLMCKEVADRLVWSYKLSVNNN